MWKEIKERACSLVHVLCVLRRFYFKGKIYTGTFLTIKDVKYRSAFPKMSTAHWPAFFCGGLIARAEFLY